MNKNFKLKFLPFLLIIFSIGSAIEMEMFTPSFVDMSHFFKVSAGIMGWTITSNLIGFIIGSFFIGPISDSYGRKKTMFFGNLVLLIGAIGCVFSQSIEFLIFSRFIQGLGAATGIVLVPVIIADIYKLDKAEKFYKINSVVMNIFTAAAPVAGGFINDFFNWRANFVVVVIIEFIAWVLLIILFEESKKDQYKKFCVVSVYKNFKMVLLNNKFLAAISVPILLTMIYFIFITYAPFLYVKTFHVTPSSYSINLLVFVGVYSLSCFALINIKTTKKSLYLGCFLNTIAFALMFLSESPYFMTFTLCLHAVGSAFLVPPIFAYSMNIFPDHKGASSSALTVSRNIFLAFGVWIAGLFYNDTVFSIAMPLFLIAVFVVISVVYIVKYLDLIKKSKASNDDFAMRLME